MLVASINMLDVYIWFYYLQLLIFWFPYHFGWNPSWVMLYCSLVKNFHVFIWFLFLWTLIWSFQCNLLRETVIIGGLGSRNNVVDSHGSQSAEGDEFALANMDESSHGSASTRLPGAELLCKNRNLKKNINLVPQVNWVSFFEAMRQVAKTHSAKCVRIEAISVMNLILMRNNTYLEKEK